MNRKIGHKLNRKGFSLGELLIVVAIISILAGISVPLFSKYLANQQIKHVKEQELAAKVAATSAFYAGYDSKGKTVDITQTGVCTFLYDAEKGMVYVSNTTPDVADFEASYGGKIAGYGLNIAQDTDYSGKVILVYFDGRYFKKQNEQQGDFYKYRNMSKGTFEEPCMYLEWYDADSLIE